MFRIYGRENCDWCKKALTHIRTNFPNDEIEYIDYEKDSTALNYLKDNGWKTVPQIFHDNFYIGGFESLELYTKKFYGV